MKKLIVLFILLLLAVSQTSVFAADSWMHDLEDCKKFQNSSRAMPGDVARSGSVSVCVNSSGSDLVGSDGENYYHARRITMLELGAGVNLPAGDYTAYIWVCDESGKLRDEKDTDAALLTFHSNLLVNVDVMYKHEDKEITPVKLTLASKGGDFVPTGKTETVGGKEWVEYSADFTSAQAFGKFALWMYCPVPYADGAKKNIYIDDLTVTAKKAAAAEVTTAATQAPVVTTSATQAPTVTTATSAATTATPATQAPIVTTVAPATKAPVTAATTQAATKAPVKAAQTADPAAVAVLLLLVSGTAAATLRKKSK